MKDYSVRIEYASKELTKKESIKMCDISNAIPLDEATQQGSVLIDYDFHVVLNIHNEKSKDKDYQKIVLVDKAGTKFATGSKTFMNTLSEIVDMMADAPDEEYQIECYRKESKNYAGKQFITCSVV